MWEALPEWLRWILYIPTVLLILFLFNSIFTFINYDLISKQNSFIGVFTSALQAVISAGVFTFISWKLAPRAKKATSLLFYGIISIIFFIGMFFAVKDFQNNGMSYLFATDLLRFIIWFAVGFWVYTRIDLSSS